MNRRVEIRYGFSLEVHVEVGDLPLALSMSRGRLAIAPEPVARALAGDPVLRQLEETGASYVGYADGALFACYRDGTSPIRVAQGREALTTLGDRLTGALAGCEQSIIATAPRRGPAYREEIDETALAAHRDSWLAEVAEARRHARGAGGQWARWRTAAAPVLQVIGIVVGAMSLGMLGVALDPIDRDRDMQATAYDFETVELPEPVALPAPAAAIEPMVECADGYREATWSPWGERVALLCGSQVNLLDPTTGDVRALTGGTAGDLAWTHDGTWLLGAGSPEAAAWRASDGSAHPWPEGAGMWHLAASPDDSWLAAIDRDGDLRLTRTSREPPTRWRWHRIDASGARALVWSPASERLAVIESDSVRIVEPGNGRNLTYGPIGYPITGVSWSAGGGAIAVAGGDGDLTRIYDVDSGEDHTVGAPGGAVEFSPAMPVLATADMTGTVRTWMAPYDTAIDYPIADGAVGTRYARAGALAPTWVGKLTWSPDGRMLATTGDSVTLLDPATGDRTTLPGDPGVVPETLEFSPSQRFLLASSSQRTLVWQLD